MPPGINRLGILQGRVMPERLSKLQLFPISNWEREFAAIHAIGFRNVELLFDKKMLYQNAIRHFNSLRSLSNAVIKPNKLNVYSLCADFLTLYSGISGKTRRSFYEGIIKLIDLVKDTTVKIVVIPFFGNNLIKSKNDLICVLDRMVDWHLDRIAREHDIVLSLEVNLPAGQIADVFSQYKFKNIKICYDLGNVRADGRRPEKEIFSLKGLIAHVHIKDRATNGPNVMLGDGDVNFSACFRSLKKIDYTGLLILETGYFKEPYIEASKNLIFIKKALKGSRS